jgi:hypothetical protein
MELYPITKITFILMIVLWTASFISEKRRVKKKEKYEHEQQLKLNKEKEKYKQLEGIVRSKLPHSDDNFYIERYLGVGNMILEPYEKVYHVLSDNKKFRMSVIEENGQPTLYKWIQIKD